MPSSPPLTDSAASRALSEVIERIYAAAADPRHWPEVLLHIGQAVSGTQTLLFAGGPGAGMEALRCPRTSDEVLYPFLEHFGSVNLLAAPCDRMFPEGTVRFSHVAVPDAVFEDSEFYQDFFRPNDMYYSFGVKQHAPGGALAYLSVQRPRRARPFTEREGARLALLWPHLQRALTLQATLQRYAATAATAQDALAAFGQILVGVNAAGCIIYASPAAEQLLREGTVIYAANGTLRARGVRCDQKLQMALRAVLQFDATFAHKPPQAVLLRKQHGDAPVRVVVLPRRTVPALGGVQVEALLCFSGGDAEPVSRQGSLRALYALTATECRVADLLLAGKDVKEVAESLRMTGHTARFHVKRILGKTGTRRQAELIRLMTELPLDQRS